jgi:hypothetical protein
VTAAREEDLRQLTELLEDHGGELADSEREAFTDMRAALRAFPADAEGRRQLSAKQREWLRGVRDRLVPQYENLVSAGNVPRGREVPTPAVLQILPKKPPTRRPES